MPINQKIDKANTILSVGMLMNTIRPKNSEDPNATRTLRKIAITTFQGETLTFSEDEVDIDETVRLLKFK